MKLHEVIPEVIKGHGLVHARGTSPETNPFTGEYKITYSDGSLSNNIEEIVFWKINTNDSKAFSLGNIPINIDWGIHVSDIHD